MSVVETALRRPYTVAALLILIILMGVGTLMGVGAALRMPIDIFPEIDIPVVAVVWTQRNERAGHPEPYIDAAYERQLASLVDDISRIEATSYEGVGVEKVYLHEGADVTRRLAARQQRVGEQFAQPYKSLGGGWQNYQSLPAIRRPQPAIIAAFRRVLSSSGP